MLRDTAWRPGRRAYPWPRRGLILAILAVALLGTALPLHAMGHKEDPLSEAKALIAEKRYDDAIISLKAFIQKNPDRFDEAQQLLRQVIEARSTYTKVAQELVDLVRSDPEGLKNDRKLELINQLYSLEAPNDTNRKFLVQTEKLSAYLKYKSDLAKLFARAKTLLDEARSTDDGAKFATAVATYEEGFSIYRRLFDEGPYDPLTKSAVAGIIDKIKAEAAAYVSSQGELSRLVAGQSSALALPDPEAASTAWTALEAALKERVDRRNAVIAAAQGLPAQFRNVVKAEPELECLDSSFIPFAHKVALGRTAVDEDNPAVLPEGVAGSMDIQWIYILNRLQTEFEASLDAEYAKALAAYAKADWVEAQTAFEKASGLAGTGLQFFGLWGLTRPRESVPELADYWKDLLKGKPRAKARDSHLAAVSGSGARLAAALGSAATASDAATAFAAGLKADSPLAPSLAGLAASRAVLVDLEAKIAAETKLASDQAKELQSLQAQGLSLESSQTAQKDLEAKIEAATASVLAKEIGILSLAYDFEYQRLAAELDTQTKDTEAAQALLAGREDPENPKLILPNGTVAPGTGTLLMYPGESLARLTAQAPRLADLRTRLGSFAKKTSGESPRVLASPEVQAWVDKAKKLEADAQGLEAQRASLLARAQIQKNDAESKKAQAKLREDESRRALDAQNFDLADSKLSDANESYRLAFEKEANPGLKKSWTDTYEKLRKSIQNDRVDKAVKDIGKLLAAGTTLFYQDNFLKAGTAFTQANNISQAVLKFDDPTATRWLALVDRALSGNKDRTVDAKSPLYAEMSQLISLARTYYSQGQALLAQKKKAEADAAFSQAQDKIKQIKQVFPYNQEASVLGYRISKIQDPQAYRADISAKIATAKKESATPTKDNLVTLRDISLVDPGFQGLSEILKVYEDSIGVTSGKSIAKVINTADKNAAQLLVTRAQDTYDSRDIPNFGYAVDDLARAIALDPTNASARSLYDKLILMVASRQTPLSAAAEVDYRSAIAFFQSGDYPSANALVDRLLADPKNRTNPNLIDLSKKIKARL